MKKITQLFTLLTVCFAFNAYAQDTCGTAVAVTSGVTNTTTITDGTGSSEMAPSGTDSAWYTFTAPGDGTIDVSACNGGADTDLSVGTGTCGTLTPIAQNDDECDLGTGDLWASEVTGVLVSNGVTYYIEWSDEWEDGPFDWTLTFTPAPACGDPEAVTADTVTGTQIDFSWTAPTFGTPTGYNWEIQPDNVAQGTPGALATGVGVAGLTDSSGAVLTAGMPYDLYIQTDCGGSGTSNYVLFEFSTPAPPPSNDECASPINVTVNPEGDCTSTVTTDHTSATDSGATYSCDTFGTNIDTWYTFDAPASGDVEISVTNGTQTGTFEYAVFDACAGTEIDCGGGTSVVSGLTPSTTYVLAIWYDQGGEGDFTLCLSEGPMPPANDDFANAQALNCNDNILGSTSLATLDEDDAPDGFGADMDAPNVWFSYTGSGSAEDVTIDLCPSAYDTSVLIYTGTSGNLTLVAGNDDNAAECGGQGGTTRSYLTFTSDGTSTYWIAVEGWNSGSVGDFDLTITCASACSPAQANQDCASAIAAPSIGTAFTADNTCATVNADQPTCDLFNSIADVWYTFTGPASGEVDVTTANSISNGTLTATATHVAVYSGTCGALTELACSSADEGTVNVTGLTDGVTYYLQVWNNGSEEGTQEVTITEAPLSVESFENQNAFTYYPNPVKNTLNLNAQNNIQNVSIYNILGQEVLRTSPNSVDSVVDMSELANGSYFVKVSINDTTQTIRILKQ
ncbi:T9SS type A sorting domain-containing protein [Winogradskyella sp. 3972H.M.0a.05]|uniref:T9SS type A sorting domain-containing protein n=1 Tax=Winogradskyella sp. 3972H.M.0a.05 TaxID=2950277 RepID=UPI00339885BD